MNTTDFLDAFDGGRRSFTREDLSRITVSGKDLTGIVFDQTNLTNAMLDNCNLSDAMFSETNLIRTMLTRSNLTGAQFRGVNLSGANLRGATLPPNFFIMHSIVPQEGAFTGFKKLREGEIAELRIPAIALRCGGTTSRKCRASAAVVASITDENGNAVQEGRSWYSYRFCYRVGETVKADFFNPDPAEVCSGGIHFFLSREEAKEYNF